MGGPAAPPRGVLPVSRNDTMPSSFHRFQRAPFGVISGAAECQPATGAAGIRFRVAPFIHMDLMKLPLSIFGVWQSWHLATSSARYLPRATLSSCPNATITKAASPSGSNFRSVGVFDMKSLRNKLHHVALHHVALYHLAQHLSGGAIEARGVRKFRAFGQQREAEQHFGSAVQHRIVRGSR